MRPARTVLALWPRHATSRIAVVEMLRAVRRRDPRVEHSARHVLARLSLLAITDRLLLGATAVAPAEPRAIDALHVASALRLGRALSVFVSYDRHPLDAAEALGLPIASPR